MSKKYYKETNLQNDIILYLEALNYIAYNIIVASKAGVSDIIACIEGRFAVIEVKLKYNSPSALQTVKQNKVRAAGGYAIIAKSLEDVAELVEQIKKDQSTNSK